MKGAAAIVLSLGLTFLLTFLIEMIYDTNFSPLDKDKDPDAKRPKWKAIDKKKKFKLAGWEVAVVAGSYFVSNFVVGMF